MLDIVDVIYFIHCRVDVIIDSAESDSQAVQQYITRTHVTVSRLSNRPDVAECFTVSELPDTLEFFESVKFQIFGENTRQMRMSHEAITIDQCKELFHFSLIVDVFGENILLDWIARRAMHEEEFPFTVSSR